MEGPDLDRLALPQMVTSTENDESMYTAFAVTVDLRDGTSTGRYSGFNIGGTVVNKGSGTRHCWRC